MARRGSSLVVVVALALTVVGLGGTAASATSSVPLVVDGGWQSFDFYGVGFTADGPFTYRHPAMTVLKVTDAYCWGDRFRIFDNGRGIGAMSVPASPDCGDGGTADPDTAFGSGLYSHGYFCLTPGSHSISIEVTASPFGSGGAFIEASFQSAQAYCSKPRP